jgi:allophanate hydrolase
MSLESLPFTFASLRQAYAQGLRPEAVVEEAFRRLDAVADPGIFIHEAREAAVAKARALSAPDGKPLWGIPFAVKDNIDAAAMPTTAACPDFAYEAETDAFVLARLGEAGAICLGKTNLDQFATGLVGVRTPYPAPRNALDPAIVPGGSSSGSAVAVANGIAAFALGTDTAGSGRVPAALNGIVGLKPTLGALSSSGVVPACRTLDTVSVFATTVADAWDVYAAMAGYDAADPYSRRLPEPKWPALPPALRVGVPDKATLETFGDTFQLADFRSTVLRLQANGVAIVELDFEPFYAVARMLYEGAWLAERVAAVGRRRLIEAPGTLHPTTLAVLRPGVDLTAVDAFEGMYRLRQLRRDCDELLASVDLLCVPSIPTFVTTAEVAADPIGPNARLGTYTNFVNLLDMCGIAVPTGTRSDGRPGSATFLAAAGRDGLCAALAASLEAGPMGATGWARPAPGRQAADIAPDEMAVAVCGAHMSGLPLNRELTSRGARFLRACRTSASYGLHALPGHPARPGLVRRGLGGSAIAVEVWALPQSRFGEFIAGVPAPLCIGSVALEDGTAVKGFLCESHGIAGATDITGFGGWRAYLEQSGREAVARAV